MTPPFLLSFIRKTIVGFLIVLITFLVARGDQETKGELRLHPLFTDHAVLQQGLPVPVWGTAGAGNRITVSFAGQTAETRADEDGNWMVTLKPLTASTEGADLEVKSNGSKIAVTDILVGEVWVCSGQSNMAWTVSRTTSAKEMATEANAGEFEGIRLFKVPVAGADEPARTVNATWQLPTAPNVANFSATGFYFGRALHRDRNISVGLIQSANGGTNAYSWINSDTMTNDEAAATVRDYWSDIVERGEAALEQFETRKQAWIDGGRKGGAPREPLHAGHVKRPAGHYNAMIAPLQPYAMKGVIWYQGEANSRHPFAPEYRDLMFALVDDWRADWHAASGADGEPRKFPFYLVQLPNFERPDEGWPVIREQMLKFWQEGENTGMVVAIDVGDPQDIHPRNKLPVGERLARFARAGAYGDDIVYSGPVYESMRAGEGQIVLEFKHTGGGLKSLDGQPLRHFEIADANGNFAPATAKIEGNTLVVNSPDIAEPRAVRYAWKPNPENVNFANGEDLPASPFRTDSWEISLSPQQ